MKVNELQLVEADEISVYRRVYSLSLYCIVCTQVRDSE